MSLDTLVLDTKLNLDGWQKGLADGNQLFADYQAKSVEMGVKLPAPPPLALPAPNFPDVAGGLRKAFEPLAGMLGKQAALFEKMAGSILATNRRLDGDIKYDKFQASLTKLRAKVKEGFDEMSESAQKRTKAIDTALGAVQGFSRFRAAIDGLISHDRKARQEIDKVKPKLISLGTAGTVAMKGVAGATEKASSSMKGLGVAIGLSLGPALILAKGFEFLRTGISSASTLYEVVGKTGAIFKDSAGAVEAYGDKMAKEFGLSKTEILDLSSGFGGIYKGLGDLTGPALTDASTKMTGLAADLSSIANIDLSDAGNALRTALAGEQSDVLKKLGVDTKQAAVEAYAYSHNIGKLGDELTSAQLTAARTGLIFEGLADAQGDLARTSGSSANQSRALSGRISNLATAIGTTFLPVVQAGLGVVNSLVMTVSKGFASSKGLVDGWVEGIASKIRYFGAIVANPGAAFAVLKLRATEVFLNVTARIEAFGTNAGRVFDYAGRVTTSFFRDLATNARISFINVTANLARLALAFAQFANNPAGGIHVDFSPLTAGFVRTIEKWPGLVAAVTTDMSKEIAAATKPLDEAFAKAEKARDDAAKQGPSEAAAGVAHKEDKLTEKLADFVKDFRDGIKSPMDRYAESTKLLKEALDKKLITDDEFKKGDAYNRKEAGLENGKFAGALQMATPEAYSAVLAAQTGRGNSFAQKTTENTGALVGIGRQQVAAMGDMVKAMATNAVKGVGNPFAGLLSWGS